MTQPADPAITYWWENMAVGTQLDVPGSVTVTREDVLEFASRFDPQPFHLDDEAAARSMFGKLSASGWHTCAMAMGLMVRGFLKHAASLGSPGMEQIKWLTPVYPGDTLRLTQTVTDTRPMKSRPDVGLIRATWGLFNQHGEQVLMMDGWGMFRRRAPGTSAGAGA